MHLPFVRPPESSFCGCMQLVVGSAWQGILERESDTHVRWCLSSPVLVPVICCLQSGSFSIKSMLH